MDLALLAPLALFLGIGGLVAHLAGAVGLRDTRRLRRVGVPVRALVRYRAAGPDDRTGSPRPLLQFTTADDAVVEVFSPVPAARSQPLPDGGQVWISYDPADPRQVAVRGRERAWLDVVFLALGGGTLIASLTLFLLAV
ncbi:DUF3592 domain-containing protein [Kitasatospora sp. NPDC049258]|uniref:DUF3592 domain-containing protein n=1 Tax=Kitasatospora sp. NPDC049258 TaxID=3155394 RepID=UPI00341937CA